MVEFQHVQLHKLINGTAALVCPCNGDLSLALTDFECGINFFQVFEERRPERFINQLFVNCESGLQVLHYIFDHLAIERVSFQFEHVTKLLEQ